MDFTPLPDPFDVPRMPEEATPARPARRRRMVPAAMALGIFATGGAGFAIGHLASAAAPATASVRVPNPSGSSRGESVPTVPSGSSGTGSGTSAGGGPSSAAAIASRVDPGLVDINTSLGYSSAQAAGTGMVLTSNGVVLTNNHVVKDATSISVTDIGNGRTYSAKVVGYDTTHDVAVLQLADASGLATVIIGDSSSVKPGDAVVGIGNAGGVGGTPSYAGGAVTALDQSITAADAAAGTSETLTGLLATDADIQAGDSGGPLVNVNGQVIGIDTAGSSGSTGFGDASSGSTSGFAVPINTAISIVHRIESGKGSSTVHVGPTAFLGVDVAPSASSGTSSGLGGSGGFGFGFGNGGIGNTGNTGTASPSGVDIVSVIGGGPAARAGLAAGDTITSLDGRSVMTPDSLSSTLGGDRPGSTVRVGYLDPGGQSHTLLVTLGSGPAQ